MNFRAKIAAIAAGAILIPSALAGCQLGGDKANEPFKDASRNGTDNGSAKIVTMPDGFSNGSWKCLEGTHVLLISAYHGNHTYASLTAVVDPQDCHG